MKYRVGVYVLVVKVNTVVWEAWADKIGSF